MEAKGQSLKMLFDTDVLEVPFFQRPYVWNEENWKELLDDLRETQATHFLGSVILKKKETHTWEPNKSVIIDGQQRLTTLSILIKALYDCMQDEKENIFDDAKHILFYKEKSSDKEFKVSIEHSYTDRHQFDNVIGKVEDRIITPANLERLNDQKNSEQSLLIMRCYKYFYDELSKLYRQDKQEVIDLWNSLLNKDNNIVVVINLEQTDNEQKIFDSINTAGMRLSATDTIKNALYKKLMEISDDKDGVIQYYKQTWEDTFEGDEEKIEYWTKESKFGRITYQNSEILLRSIAMINKFFTTYGNSMTQLSVLYKKHVEEKEVGEIKDLIKDIMEYAKVYKERLPNFRKTDMFEFDDVERRILKTLEIQESSVFNPYILYLFKEYSNDKETLKKKLEKLEKLVMRKLITRSFNQGINKKIEDFIGDNEDKEIDRLCKEVDIEMIRKSLSTRVSNKLGTILLFWVELHRRYVDKKHDIKSLQYNYQLEHIMPKKWEDNWGKIACVDAEGNKLPKSDDKYKKKRIEKITSIGNMTLLTSSLNSAISNSSFEIKIEGEKTKKGNRKGIKDYAELSITRDDIIKNVYDKGKVWNEKEIIKREQALINEIIEIWG